MTARSPAAAQANRTSPALAAQALPHHEWRWLVPRLLRAMLLTGGLALTIAVVLTVIDGRGFGYKLLYSAAISFCCWFLTDGLRLVIAVLVARLEHRRGQPPRHWLPGWSIVLPLCVLAFVVGPNVGLALGDAITGFESPPLWRLDQSGTRTTLTMTGVGLLAAVVSFFVQERLAQVRTETERAQRQAAETQLQLLQAQLEPHMLFNTLANLRVLIGSDPARAQAMLDRLIGFLRATLQASRSGEHRLDTEFARIDDYLQLMAVRMGSRLQATLSLPEALRGHPVPPLLLQPLVENAIQHGLEPQVAGGTLHVQASAEPGPGGALQLVLSVTDSGCGLASSAARASSGGTHFGLVQVRERLTTLYGSAASLSLLTAASGQGSCARVVLPLQEGAP